MVDTKEAIENKLRMAVLKSAELLVENGLSDWKIKINNRRSSLAEAWHSEKTIFFSKYFLIVADQDQLIGVTLHEATHALLGRGHGHNSTFVEKCKEISPTDEYAQRSADIPLRRYILTCPDCGQRGSNNLNLTRYCGKCFINESKQVAFNIEPNELKVKEW